MRRIISKLQQQRGQVIIMFVGLFTIITVIGAITIDFGLWFSERRGSQNDADMIALAGAQECMLQLASGGAYTADVPGAVQRWFDLNNNANAGNATLDPPASALSCEQDDQDRLCVTVGIHHSTRALFASIFDKVAPDIGAHARACAGAANGLGPSIPFEVATQDTCFVDGQPRFGEVCPLEGGSHGKCPEGDTSCTSNPRGILDLLTKVEGYCSDQGSSAHPERVIPCGAEGMCQPNEDGAQGACPDVEWYDCADVQDGNPQAVLNGVQCRLEGSSSSACPGTLSCVPPGEGLCDANHDGIDSFDESVTLLVASNDPAKRVYEAKDCDPSTAGKQISSRLGSVVVFDHIPSKNETQPIITFAGFYLEGCSPDTFDPDPPTVQQLEDWFELQGNDEDHYRQCNVGTPGLQTVYGRFFNLVCAGCGAGPVDQSTTMFGIALVDWEGGGGTPGPTATPVPTVAPTSPPPPTVAPTSPPPTPPVCPPQCILPNGKCKNNCP